MALRPIYDLLLRLVMGLVPSVLDLQVSPLIRGLKPQLSDQELAAYDAPYPDMRFEGALDDFRSEPWLSLK